MQNQVSIATDIKREGKHNKNALVTGKV